MSNTICALSTPAGLGAVALIRISGNEAFTITETLFSEKLHFNDLPPQVARFAQLYDGDQVIDQVVVVKYAHPRSFTGEDMVEISCHGSIYIQRKILQLLVERGSRMAAPGEFTQRAFLNGKLDLPQAEAIADLIDSQTETAHKLAINQLKGGFSNKIKELREQFVTLASLIELELDFSEEDVEFANRDELKRLLSDIKVEVDRLIRSFKMGNALKNGIPVAIVGKPNAGKSTLLNAILQHERAIVSSIPGTTRDTIEDTFNIKGTLFRFIDTAGIRNANDEIESIGIERTYQAAQQANVILYMVDITSTTPAQLEEELSVFQSNVNLADKKWVVVANKIDGQEASVADWKKDHVVCISAKERTNIETIEKMLDEYVAESGIRDFSLLTNERHYAHLTNIMGSIQRIENGMAMGIPTDLLAEDVRAALYDLGSLTGTISTDELLGNIFGKFCIGK